jgi:hypothetical protein
MQITQLAHGKITNADTLIIELREPDNEPAAVLIHWPSAASVASPAAFPTVASKITTIVASLQAVPINVLVGSGWDDESPGIRTPGLSSQ